jgi:uncharacterized membrane protein YeaQ/YmgE (transglycosylase-associated protein family)
MLLFIIYTLVLGLVVGALARLALPGPDPMTMFQTALLGVAGSLLAGLISWFLLGHAAGFILSVAGSTLILYFIRRSRGGSLSRGGGRRTLLR